MPRSRRRFKRHDGAYLSVVAAPEGQRWIAMFQHAAGTPPGQNISPTQSFEYGRTVAHMHQVFDQITTPCPRPELNLATLLTNPLQTLAPWFGERAADWDFLTTLADVASAQVATVPQTAPFYGLCHGDLHKTNLLCSDDGRLTVLDFDLCGVGWRSYDLAVLWWSTRFLPQAQAVRQEYGAGYAMIRPLDACELAALPYWVAIRDIFIMATELRHARRGVAGVMIDAGFFDRHLQFLRAWMQAIRDKTYNAV